MPDDDRDERFRRMFPEVNDADKVVHGELSDTILDVVGMSLEDVGRLAAERFNNGGEYTMLTRDTWSQVASPENAFAVYVKAVGPNGWLLVGNTWVDDGERLVAVDETSFGNAVQVVWFIKN